MHADRITDWASVPTLVLPPGSCRLLTAQECLAKVEETQAALDRCIDPGARRYLQGELNGWNRLAVERASAL